MFVVSARACASKKGGDVPIATRVPCPSNESAIFFEAVPAKCEYASMEGLH